MLAQTIAAQIRSIHRYEPVKAVSTINFCTHCKQPVCQLGRLDALCLDRLCDEYEKHTDAFRKGHHHDPRYGYELFRRALVEKDEVAWDRVYEIHKAVTVRWVKRHPRFPMTGESDDYFVNRAFAKFHRYFDLDSSRFEKFGTLAALLALLWKQCVRDVIRDHRINEAYQLDDATWQKQTNGDDYSDQIVFWHLLKSILPEQDYLALAGYYLYNLKNRDIATMFPEDFRSPRDVFNSRQRAEKKLSEDETLHDALRSLI